MKVIQSAAETGQTLHASKCKIIATNFNITDNIDTFKDFRQFIAPQDMTLLGASVLKGPAVDLALQNKVNDLHIVVGRLALCHSRNALVLL